MKDSLRNNYKENIEKEAGYIYLDIKEILLELQETFIENEKGRNSPDYRKILSEKVSENYLKSKYITSAFYYSDSFLNKVLPELVKKYPKFKSYNIVNDINEIRQLRPKLRQEYINMLLEKCENLSLDFVKIVKPLTELKMGTGMNHLDAVDYFIEEGSPIFSINAGVVVAIEESWSKENIGNNISEKGGNFVIIFNPKTREFSRYCHMESASKNIEVGQVISAGIEIGTVGHTGLNASKKGHGNHLHIEINKFENNGKMISQNSKYIKKKLSF